MRRNEERIERTVVETKVTFVACDGTVFKTEEECKKYEESYECTMLTCFKKIPHLEKCGSDLYMQYANEEDVAYILKPRNIDDIYAVNRVLDYCDSYCGGVKAERLTQDDINKCVLINFGYEGLTSGWYMIKRKDDYLKEIKGRLDKYEEEIDQLNKKQED